MESLPEIVMYICLFRIGVRDMELCLNRGVKCSDNATKAGRCDGIERR